MKVAVPRGFQMRSCGKYNHVQYAHKMEDGDRQVKTTESEGYKNFTSTRKMTAVPTDVYRQTTCKRKEGRKRHEKTQRVGGPKAGI